jgi:HEAT repeat protein
MLNSLRNIFAGPDGRLRNYLSDPYSNQKKILRSGERAIPGLIAMLDNERDGPMAASLLGRLGDGRSDVVAELRKRFTGHGGVSESSARALARLGEIEFLVNSADDKAKRQQAIHGIVSLLKENSVSPLDYRPVDELLNFGPEGVAEIVNEESEPGSSLIQIKPSDIGEALRGLQSDHIIVRQHAVRVLGDRSLGSEASKVVLPALAEQLEDDNADVRRLALLALSYWKSAAKPYHDEMRKRMRDNDGNVRATATYVLE